MGLCNYKKRIYVLIGLLLYTIHGLSAFPTEEYELKNGKKVKIELLPEGRFTRVEAIKKSYRDTTTVGYVVVSPMTYGYADHYNGVASTDGKIIIHPKYKYIFYQDGCFVVQNFGDKKGVVDIKGKKIIEPQYDNIYFYRFKDTDFVYFSTVKDGKIGIITAEFKDGKYKKVKEILKPKEYADAYFSAMGFTVSTSKRGGFKGRLDMEGNVTIKPDRYNDIQRTEDGRYIVRIGNRCGVCDSKGEQLFFTDFNALALLKNDDGSYFYKGIMGNSEGSCDYDGNIINKPSPTFFSVRINKDKFSCNQIVDERGNVGIADTLGNILIPAQYDGFNIYDGLIYGYRDGYEALFTFEGTPILPISRHYTFIVPDKNKSGEIQKIRVYRNEFMGYCDADGNELLGPDKWTYVDLREEGFEVQNNGFRGLIDKTGKFIIPCAYDYISKKNKHGYYYVKSNALEGIVDSMGSEIVPPVYTYLIILETNRKSLPFKKYIQVKSGDYMGLYSMDGNVIFPVSTFTDVSLRDFGNGEGWQTCICAKDGYRECYYDFQGNLIKDKTQDRLRDGYMLEASEHFKKKKWKDAFKAYEHADAILSDYYSTFNMGVSKFNDGKYSDAIKHLNSALKFNPGLEKRENIYSIINEAREAIDEISTRRQATFLSILTTGLNIAADIINMNATQNQRRANLRSNNYNQDNYTDNSNTSTATSTQPNSGGKKCGFCGGIGSIVENTTNYGIKKDFRCDECGKTVTNGHYHRTCTHCGGKGIK